MREVCKVANKNKLSIYLIKHENSDNEDIFDKPEKIQEFQKYPDGSVAYFVPSYVHEPSWLSSFFHKSGQNDLLQANSRVVLLKKLKIDE